MKAYLFSFGLAAVLAGCNPMAERYDTARAELRADPKLRTTRLANCVKNFAAKPAPIIESAAALMNVPQASAPRLFCQRLFDGIASGRITREDVQRIERFDDELPPSVYRALKGRG